MGRRMGADLFQGVVGQSAHPLHEPVGFHALFHLESRRCHVDEQPRLRHLWRLPDSRLPNVARFSLERRIFERHVSGFMAVCAVFTGCCPPDLQRLHRRRTAAPTHPRSRIFSAAPQSKCPSLRNRCGGHVRNMRLQPVYAAGLAMRAFSRCTRMYRTMQTPSPRKIQP